MSATATRTEPAPSPNGSSRALPAGRRRILILGGGFAGAFAAMHLEKRLAGTPDLEIALISKENFVLFTPMLHEVAGSDVAITDIVQSLRKILRRARVAIAEVESIDLNRKLVRIRHKMPGLQKKVRVALDWMLDLFFSKDIVQLPTLHAPRISQVDDSRLPAVEMDRKPKQQSNGEPNSRRGENANA
jgi:hypothetical protein